MVWLLLWEVLCPLDKEAFLADTDRDNGARPAVEDIVGGVGSEGGADRDRLSPWPLALVLLPLFLTFLVVVVDWADACDESTSDRDCDCDCECDCDWE